MSKYTTEVRWFCESKYLGDRPENIDEVIQATYPYILKQDLLTEIFDPNYYPIIAKKIIRHYYFREIGAETVGLWIYWMNTRFSELLPYYNALWKSALLELDPFKDVDYTREGQKEGKNQEASQGKTTESTTGGTKESATMNSTEHGNAESKESGSYNLTGSETGRESTDKIGTIISEKDSTSTDSGEENVNSTKTGRKVTDNDTTATVNETTTGEVNHTLNDTKWDLYSDTPQGAIVDLDNNRYLTNARKNTDLLSEKTTSTETRQGTTTGALDETVTDTENGTNKTAFGKIVDYIENNRNEESENLQKNDNRVRSENNSDERSTQDISDRVNSSISEKTNSTEGSRVGENSGLKTGNDEEKWLEKITGKMNTTSYSELLEKYRKTFMNIDLMFIKEFDDLFMRLW